MIPFPVFDDAGKYIPQEWERPKPGETIMIQDLEVIAVQVETENPFAFAAPGAHAARAMSHAFSKGILPFPGSLLQQPARALEAIRIWDNAVEALKERHSARIAHV